MAMKVLRGEARVWVTKNRTWTLLNGGFSEFCYGNIKVYK